ncbi:MAG: acetate--CoA ligase [Candidatus Abyssobacteria bacterium SURF_17]|uniref:Acetyl-coenzyme A synthetase n=1 Tax=Candidatus Abyssobacteria bacterium SURF_17 TaxID=2093361 RepID=A0A419F414_9BACT|nr:MAG: acetate--CoA ligase [Candidatus Abyssubacteria bacterium SURF_17]
MQREKGITSMMDEQRKFPPPKGFQDKAHIKSLEEYERLYKQSLEDPDGFWGKCAEELDWVKKWDRVYYWDPDKAECRWFEGGKLNVSQNCLDRHLKTWRKNKAAIIWEGEPVGDSRTYTYQQLHREVCRFANVLKKKGIKKGDRVCIYLPMIPELPIAMLACARIGAIHSVVFGGFSAESLRDRIQDSGTKMLITVDASYRNGRILNLKKNADEAVARCPSIERIIVVNRANQQVTMQEGKETWWHDEMNAADIKDDCPPEAMDAEDPLFILYTSGSTGKPKGVLHTTAGYLIYTAQSFRYIFDYKDEDTFWCTADIGWVTGHSYIVYGPLCEGATSLMYEGVPTFPERDRFWAIVEKYKVNIFYTAPTAIRALMREGEQWPARRDLSSLRLLGTVGEPINPEAWMWYYTNIGKEKCPIVDTWWQTETGGILITPLPGAFTLKPASANKPFFGVEPAVIREDGSEARPNEGGYLVIRRPWPGMMRTVYGDPKRFKDTYFSLYPGIYFTGDGARKDEDGDYWLMGRIDDVINVSGHRLGTAEIESALVAHPMVAESAVVPMPHEIKGQGIYAFVILKAGVEPSDALRKELVAHVRKEIGAIATPDELQFAEGLPKTRSGKIMRRILRKIAEGSEQLGDTTTLADTGVVESLLKGKKK